MTTSILTIDIAEQFPGMSTREMGSVALCQFVNKLTDADILEINFSGIAPSPSFADQCIGGLAEALGLVEFKARVKLKNLPTDVQPLIRHVILTKAQRAVAH
ncbi:STAS-like domain-containing protein [Ideonella sp. B508-1]|uniref:STAS-like domain-containing protein n=1 Tax=Ideonella sp. B508-1 TaxID=137716 RepID=UPI0003B50AE5|nr:STAS-like domain-containing protein [Ideonella sp. B508-1]